MLEPLEEKKIKFEIAEKVLICITLVIAIAASAYQGYQFLNAKKLETRKKTESIELLTAAYLESLKTVTVELREIDEKMAQAPWKLVFKKRTTRSSLSVSTNPALFWLPKKYRGEGWMN